MDSKNLYPLLIAEFIGTFFMVFFGCGSMILAQTNPDYASGFVPIIWGGSVTIMIYAVGHISGAHFNPAVTIAFWSLKRIKAKRVVTYIIAQLLGALAASTVHSLIWTMDHSFGATMLSVSPLAGFFVELILSFALMFVIASVATDSRAVGEMAGLAIGLTVALDAFVGGPLTNASMNPARSIGPAILNGNFSNIWIYLSAPVLGTVLGAKCYDWIRCQREGDQDKEGCC